MIRHLNFYVIIDYAEDAMLQPIDHEKFSAVQKLLHPIAIGNQPGPEALPHDIALVSIDELAERFDASVNRLLAPEEFKGDLPQGCKAGEIVLPGQVKLELELGMNVPGGFPPHPGWYTKRNTLKLSKDQPTEREEPLRRDVSIWTQESASPWLSMSEDERIKNIQKRHGVDLTYEAFVGVPLNVPLLAVLGMPVNHDDAVTVRVNVAPEKLPEPNERLGFAVGILLLEGLEPNQLAPGAKTKY